MRVFCDKRLQYAKNRRITKSSGITASKIASQVGGFFVFAERNQLPHDYLVNKVVDAMHLPQILSARPSGQHIGIHSLPSLCKRIG